MTDEKQTIKHPLIKLFFISTLIYLAGISPVLIMSKGVYLWVGDYNDQTIVFIERIHRLLHSGQGFPAFDWGSMMGMDFLTSYHDHLFSPFEWLLYAVPYAAVPYVHSLFLAVKIGLSAVTAYCYCRPFVKTDQSAYICGLLYAFSGYQLFNLHFQFSDRYLLFPLLLLSFDQLVINKRPLCFSLLLALYCLISPVFAWMVCLFLLIYYIVRTAVKSFPRLDLRLFLRLALETGCGVLMGALVMLPFYYVLSGNTRAGNSIFGHSLIAYDSPGVILFMIRSMLLPPSHCGVDWYLKDRQLDLSPPLLYIPLFLVLGVYTVLKAEKKAWYSILLKVCAVIACVPILNSAFAVFNYQYYARWFFMPLLIMIMMTGRYIDNIEDIKPKKEFIVGASALGFFLVYGIYSVYFEKPDISPKELWLIMAACSVLETVILYQLLFSKNEKGFISLKNIRKIVYVCCFIPFFGNSYFIVQDEAFEYIQSQIGDIWNDFEPVKIEDDVFFRTSSCLSNDDNRSLMWDYPTVNTFNSMITGDTCSFFEKAGNDCTQVLWFDSDDYALCSFLSVKYDLYYNKPLVGGIEVEPEHLFNYLEGFEISDSINKYVIYQNKAFIPMGFTYDHYLEIGPSSDNETADDKTKKNAFSAASNGVKELYKDKKDRHMLLLKAIWLTKEQAEKYGDILQELPDEKYDDVSVETYYKDCSERAASACYEFTPDSEGFNARIELPKDNLVFFSVPYSKYFTAYVDGEPTEIERVFDGLSAVYVPQGDHSISFRYTIPGFKAGCIISASAAGIMLIYTAADLILKKRRKKETLRTEQVQDDEE